MQGGTALQIVLKSEKLLEVGLVSSVRSIGVTAITKWGRIPRPQLVTCKDLRSGKLS